MKKYPIIVKFAVLSLIAAVLLTGCGSTGNSTSAEAAQEPALALLLSQEDDFLVTLRDCVQEEAEKQGCTLDCYTAEGDAQTQLLQAHEALAAGADTLLVNLTSEDSGRRIADIAGDANLVFINRAPTDRSILNEKTVFVGVDETRCGTLQGQALAAYFRENWVGTEIRYLLFQGVPGLENTVERSNGAIQGLINGGFTPVSAAKFQVCDFDRGRARLAMETLLEDGVDYDCIICNNDAMALGVIDALKAAGKDPSEVPIVGVDGTDDGVEALNSGALYMTVDQDAAVQANAAVTAAVNLRSGRPFDTGIHVPPGADGQQPAYSICIPANAVTAGR